VFAKAKKVTDNNKDTSLVDYRIHLFYDTGVGFLLVLRDSIHNTSSSSELMNGPKKLECYIKLDLKAFQQLTR